VLPFGLYLVSRWFLSLRTDQWIRAEESSIQVVGELEVWIVFATGRITGAFAIGLIVFYLWYFIMLVCSMYGTKGFWQQTLSLIGLMAMPIILIVYTVSTLFGYLIYFDIGGGGLWIYLFTLGFIVPFILSVLFAFPADMAPFGAKQLDFFRLSQR